MDIRLMDGSRIPVVVPSRYFAYTSDGRKFSTTAMVDFVADNGFNGIDVSFDLFSDLGNPLCVEGDIYSVLYSLGNRAKMRGLTLPVCHLDRKSVV